MSSQTARRCAVEITQETVAQHLGVRRAGVSVLVAEFQDHGLVSHTRGRLRVLDRRALERAACECYSAMAAHGSGRVAV